MFLKNQKYSKWKESKMNILRCCIIKCLSTLQEKPKEKKSKMLRKIKRDRGM